MTSPRPLPFRWNGDSFTPISRHVQAEADKAFTVGEVYPLEVREDRSGASHRAYFAQVNEAFNNLPEHMADHVKSAEHLRKFALIRCGYRDERSIVCASDAEAKKVAAFIRPMDDLAIISAEAQIVRVWTAKSQSYRSMSREEFQASKQSVLDYLSGMIGTTAAALKEAAG